MLQKQRHLQPAHMCLQPRKAQDLGMVKRRVKEKGRRRVRRSKVRRRMEEKGRRRVRRAKVRRRAREKDRRMVRRAKVRRRAKEKERRRQEEKDRRRVRRAKVRRRAKRWNKELVEEKPAGARAHLLAVQEMLEKKAWHGGMLGPSLTTPHRGASKAMPSGRG